MSSMAERIMGGRIEELFGDSYSLGVKKTEDLYSKCRPLQDGDLAEESRSDTLSELKEKNNCADVIKRYFSRFY